MAKKSNGIPMASFTVHPLIDRTEVMGENGKVDYGMLVQKANELGGRFYREARLFEKT